MMHLMSSPGKGDAEDHQKESLKTMTFQLVRDHVRMTLTRHTMHNHKLIIQIQSPFPIHRYIAQKSMSTL